MKRKSWTQPVITAMKVTKNTLSGSDNGKEITNSQESRKKVQ